MGVFRGVELDELRLSGPRLDLRPWDGSDVERVVEVMQDPRMHEFMRLPRPYTLDHARAYMSELAIATRRDAAAVDCAVIERSSGTLVGSCVLRLGSEPEIGYWTASDAWGNGFAAEATRTLAEWGFGVGLHRIVLLCSTGNLPSVRTALAAGFAFEGVSRDGYTVEGAESTVETSATRGDRARFARLASDSGAAIPPSLPRLPPGGLTDGELTLRVMTADDAPALCELDDEVALAWSLDGKPLTKSQAHAAASGAGLHWLVGRTGLRLAIVDTSTGSFTGALSFRLTGPPGVCLIGYTVHPSFRGSGRTTRALRIFAQWAFDVAGLARLELGARTDNIASRRAAENAGFVHEGTLSGRLRGPDGAHHDEAYYALLNPNVTRPG